MSSGYTQSRSTATLNQISSLDKIDPFIYMIELAKSAAVADGRKLFFVTFLSNDTSHPEDQG
jgi:hypothetical protein